MADVHKHKYRLTNRVPTHELATYYFTCIDYEAPYCAHRYYAISKKTFWNTWGLK